MNANGGPAKYRALPADRGAQRRALRPKRAKLAQCRRLRSVVERKLEARWSPQQISGWLAERVSERPGDARVARDHLSVAVRAKPRALRKELHACLRTGRAMRRAKAYTKGGVGQGQIRDMVMISERPAEVADRAVPGHWEGDHPSHAGSLLRASFGGADEGAVGAERAGDDAGAAGEVEAAAGVELASARRRRTARRTRARPSRRRRRAEGRAGSRPTRPRGRRACPVRSRTSSGRVDRRPTGDPRDRGARRLGFEAAARAARAHVAVGLDDHVADVARVPVARRRAAGRRARCRRRRRSTRPSRCSRARPRAAPIQPSPSASALASLSTNVGRPVCAARRAAERKRAPRGDVERRHVLAARVHRPAAPDADGDRAGGVEPVDEVGERREERVGVEVELRRRVDACAERAVVADNSRRQLGAADVDRNDVGHKGGG